MLVRISGLLRGQMRQPPTAEKMASSLGTDESQVFAFVPRSEDLFTSSTASQKHRDALYSRPNCFSHRQASLLE